MDTVKGVLLFTFIATLLILLCWYILVVSYFIPILRSPLSVLAVNNFGYLVIPSLVWSVLFLTSKKWLR